MNELEKEGKLFINPNPDNFLSVKIDLIDSSLVNYETSDLITQKKYELNNLEERFCEPLMFIEERVVYFGQMNEKQQRHGLGVQIFEDGSLYEG